MAAQVIIDGEGADTLPRDESHLVVSTFRRACSRFGLSKTGFILEAHNRIPQARGMGSSAEAIVAGIAAAYAFSHEGELDRDVIFDYAAQLEGHPDNVAPAVYGGMTVSWTQPGSGVTQPDGTVDSALYRTVNYLVGPDITASVFIPDFELSTSKAREALPTVVPFADAVFNVSRAALLIGAMNPAVLTSPRDPNELLMEATESVFIPDFELSTSKAREALPTVVPFADAVFNVSRAALLIGAMNPAVLTSPRDPNELLMEATEDKLHQAYRGSLMEPSARLITLLRANGFAAMVSGAGPCVLVLHNGDANSAIDAVAHEQLESGHWKVLHLATDTQGVQVARL